MQGERSSGGHPTTPGIVLSRLHKNVDLCSKIYVLERNLRLMCDGKVEDHHANSMSPTERRSTRRHPTHTHHGKMVLPHQDLPLTLLNQPLFFLRETKHKLPLPRRRALS